MSTIRRVAVAIDLQWTLKHHQAVYAGIQRYAREHGTWTCTVDLYAGESLHARPAPSNYDGVITRATRRLATRAKRAGVPVVNVWMNSSVRNLPLVCPDYGAGGRKAAEHLMARGLTQFGMLSYLDDRACRLEEQAFRAALAAAGHDCAVHPIKRGYDASAAKWNRFIAGLDAWVETWPRPIGVFVAHDILARYLVNVCEGRQVRVPDDAALLGCYNEPSICLHPEPALSSIDFGFEEVGYRAAALLEELMDGAEPPGEPLIAGTVELIARQSTDVFAVADPLVTRAMRFISEHSDGALRIDDVAQHVHTTRRTLERRFRSTTGHTIAGEMTRLRIERLKRHLVANDEPLKALAKRLGFRDDTSLCEAFRRAEGMTPGEYRRRHKASGV